MLPFVFAVVGLTSGCAQPAARSDVERGGSLDRGAFVLRDHALSAGRGSVLDAMEGRVPSLRIHRSRGECPSLALRNAVAVPLQAASPLVYVDGARTVDTCVLEVLRSQDTDRVEVYPQGFTLRPGYDRNAHGLILVFTRQR